MQTPSKSKAESSPSGLAREIKVKGAVHGPLQSRSLAVSECLPGLVGVCLPIPSDVTYSCHLP